MSFSKNNDINLAKKNSSSSNEFGSLFDKTYDKKDNNKIEKDSDSDDVEKKFGSVKDKSNKSKNNESESSEEEKEDENENFHLNIIEDNSTEKFSIGKYLDSNTKKKQIKKIPKNKKYKKDETFSNEEKMEMDFSASEKFIQDKQEKKNQIIPKRNSNSRFFNDFTVIKKLGKGGEGSVFEVKNNFDMQHYAIKRIILRLNQYKQKEDISEINNELYVLSRHKSPYLVRYYQAWIEDFNKEDYQDDSDFEGIEDISTISKRKVSFDEKSKSTLEKGQTNTKNYLSDGVDTSSEEEEEEEEEEKENQKLDIWGDDDEDEEEEKKEKEKEEKKIAKKNEDKNKKNESKLNYKSRNNREKNEIKILYIQMELCGNKTLRYAIDNNQLKTDDIKWKYISQLLEAIQYVHARGCIHRDLKPGNIFIDNDNDIKLGDFGLVSVHSNVKAEKNNFWSGSFFRNNTNSKLVNYGGELITMGIGTKFYRSPEQEKSKNYDNKTDIYSLGIIIFEMLYKFDSLMERDIILTKINQKSIFPPDLEEVCGKNAAKLILKCTLRDPESRPSIKEIIESKLIPSFENKQIIFKQFDELLEKNLKLINNFMNIIIEKKKNIFLDFKKSIMSNDIESSQEEISNDNSLISNKTKLKRDMTDYNVSLMNYENSYSSFFSPIIKILELNPNKENFNDSAIFSLSVYQSIYFKIQEILNNSNAIYYKFSEYELLNQYNDFCYYNSSKNKFCRIYLKEENNEYFINENGILLSKSKNMFSNLNKMISSIQNSRFNNNFTPITFYYDSSGNIKYRSPIMPSKEYFEYNDIISTTIWKDSEESFDYDHKYIINNLKIILNILSELGFGSKNIMIRINSSIILDVIYDHFLKKNIDPKKLDETKINILLTISSLLNKRDTQYNINDLTEKLKKNNILNQIPISINDLKSLIKTYHSKNNDNGKSLESFEEKEKRINEETKIKSYFEDSYWEGNIENLLKYKDTVNIDYMLIPENLQFYSGFFFQICFLKNKLIIPLIEGGITDNYFYNPEKTKQLKGFSFIINMKNIYSRKIISLGKLDKIKEDNVSLNDCLIIRTDENVNINFLNELGKLCLESGLKYQIIYKPQSVNYEFEKYYSIYRMKYLVSINLADKKKGDEKKKYRILKKKDKKEKEKEEKEMEREERENIEVTYACEDYKFNKTENLTFNLVKKKLCYNSPNS